MNIYLIFSKQWFLCNSFKVCDVHDGELITLWLWLKPFVFHLFEILVIFIVFSLWFRHDQSTNGVWSKTKATREVNTWENYMLYAYTWVESILKLTIIEFGTLLRNFLALNCDVYRHRKKLHAVQSAKITFLYLCL